MQVLSHTAAPTSPHSHLGHWGSTVTPVYLFPPRTRRPPGYPTCTAFVVLQMFGDNFVHKCTRHFRTLFVYFANCEMSILSNDAVQLLLQCVCDDRGSPWSLSVMNICSPVRKHCAPFSDTGRVHNMFAIDCNKSSVNFTGSTFQYNSANYDQNHSSFLFHIPLISGTYRVVFQSWLCKLCLGAVCPSETSVLYFKYWSHSCVPVTVSGVLQSKDRHLAEFVRMLQCHSGPRSPYIGYHLVFRIARRIEKSDY